MNSIETFVNKALEELLTNFYRTKEWNVIVKVSNTLKSTNKYLIKMMSKFV